MDASERHCIIWLERFARLLIVLGCVANASAAISVSEGGQATMGHPIVVPPGVAGMAPNLGLSYVDGGINGPVGVGWSVQGISSITRCPATRATDGKARTVTFGALDKLCLDGQRLLQTDESGSPAATQNGVGVAVAPQSNDAQGLTGALYREFRTEKDSFARVRAYGTANGTDANNGPAYFKVWTKSGQIYEYGTNPNGNAGASINAQGLTVVAVWAVSRTSDVLGNYIDFKYSQRDVARGTGTTPSGAPGREWNIAEIQYTGTGTNVAQNKIVFSYSPERPATSPPGLDYSEAYQFASKNVSIQRLDSIRTYVNSPNPAQLGPGASAIKVRTYKLTYDNGPNTGRSRLTQITECAGSAETMCLPPTKLSYTAGSAPNFAAVTNFATSAMGTMPMLDAMSGTYGILTGDFDGDGRTDILRWSNTPSLNVLYRSLGDGAFETKPAFNLTTQSLFKTDGCYYSIVADFNGDGLSDILRVSKPTCSPSTNLLFLSNGDGSFATVTLPSNIDLAQSTATVTKTSGPCTTPYALPRRPSRLDPSAVTDNFGPRLASPADRSVQLGASSNCYTYGSNGGKRFYILDVNADGILDIVTSVWPRYSGNSNDGPQPSNANACDYWSSVPCTHVYFGTTSGAFTEYVATNVAWVSLYSDPYPTTNNNTYWRLPDQADLDGDGLQDILSKFTGRWRSTGDGNFVGSGTQDVAQLCGLPIDFNGDRRSDCLVPDAVAVNQVLTLSLGASSSGPLAQFNLKTAGNELLAVDGSGLQTVGVVVEDFNGDGRQDILRWGQTAADNGIYLSSGDGSFRARSPAGLGALPRPLQASDGKSSFVLGDFLGDGTVQILHMKDSPATAGDAFDKKNQLYARAAGGLPADLLDSVTSPTGLVSRVVARQALPNTARYATDRGTAQVGTPPVIDIGMSLYVITTTSRQTVGGTLNTEYLYKGLKVERGGRGMLGFREVRQQNPGPDGSLVTVTTQYVQTYPYTGVAGVTETYLGPVTLSGARLLSRTTYAYCDITAGGAPTAVPLSGMPPRTNAAVPAPCATTAKIQRPYVYQSVEEGWDIDALMTSLPTVITTNAYNNSGDPLTITVQTTGNSVGGLQTFTKASTNTYVPDNTAGDSWILGRLLKATVQNTVPNSLPSITTASGTSPHASEQNGSGAPPVSAGLPPGVLSAILQLLLDD